MSTHRRLSLVIALSIVCAGLSVSPSRAADPPATVPTTDRLFLGFAEETAVIHTQWWEGQLELTDGDPIDTIVARLVMALEPRPHLEFGARVGFGTSDIPPLPSLEGSGATDLDLWGKYDFGLVGKSTQLGAGGLVTIPTGDNTAGLGNDAFDFELFGSARHQAKRAVFAGQIGLRFNGDGNVAGQDYSGATSGFLGGAVILPLSEQLSLIGELRYEGERIDDGDSDFRVLGGVNWRAFQRGVVRGAVAFGLSDGAPDAQFVAGYAYTF